MVLFDVNVLVHAFREDSPDHDINLKAVEDAANSEVAFGYSDVVGSGFLRIVTHPRIFDPPSPLERAFEFLERLRTLPHTVPVVAGERHWEIFRRLCDDTDATGSLIPDAYLAALAIEARCIWISNDHDFGKFENLDWRLPG